MCFTGPCYFRGMRFSLGAWGWEGILEGRQQTHRRGPRPLQVTISWSAGWARALCARMLYLVWILPALLTYPEGGQKRGNTLSVPT